MVRSKKQLKMVFVWCLVMCLGIGFGMTGMASAADKPTVWRFQSVWPTSSAIHPGLQKMCEKIKEDTNGTLEIKLFAPGEIVGTLEVFDAVSNGVIDMATTSGIYNAGKIPEGLVEFGMPFALANKAQHDEFWYQYQDGAAFKIVQEAYRKKKVQLVHINAGTSYGYMTTFPVASLADFKGKKIRSFGFFGALVQMMGGSPVNLPTEDQYLALQQGTVDGTIFPYLAMETMNFKEVTKHLVLPPVMGSPTSNIYVSAKAWDKLTPEQQAVVSKYAALQNQWYIDDEGPKEQAMIANPEKSGIQVHQLSHEEVVKLKKMGGMIWAGVAKKSENTGKLIGMLKAYLATK